jgi:uncharacterized protein (DUF488 family)
MHPIRAAIHLDRLTRRSYDEREGHMGNKVVSIGYQERSLHELLHVLKAHNVGKLIDVRQLPLSRRKGFSKTALAQSLATKRIEYCHIRSAGNPYHSQKANLSLCLNLYARYLARNPQILDEVAEEFSGRTVAVLCYERSHSDCHRSILLEAMSSEGYRFKVVKAT